MLARTWEQADPSITEALRGVYQKIEVPAEAVSAGLKPLESAEQIPVEMPPPTPPVPGSTSDILDRVVRKKKELFLDPVIQDNKALGWTAREHADMSKKLERQKNADFEKG